MIKVLTILGTRPELIRLSRTIALFDTVFEHVLVHTGQNFDPDLKEVFFTQLRIRKPDYSLQSAKKNFSETIANIFIKIEEILCREKPDAVLILGDTNSALSAIIAKKHKIPIFHVEAGNRCFDDRVPEEINRRIVDHVSDINITYSEIARDYLIKEGLSPQNIIRIGSPMYEVLKYYEDEIDVSPVLSEMGLISDEYLLVSAHRQENIDDQQRLAQLLSSIESAASTLNLPVVMSTHPRLESKLNDDVKSSYPSIKFCAPFSFFDYVKLQKNARCVISDSGSISEEASILRFRAVNFRDLHERPESDTLSATVSATFRTVSLKDAIILSVATEIPSQIVSDYICPDFSSILSRLIASKIDFVNQYTWRKYC